jgi:hypothetical protein
VRSSQAYLNCRTFLGAIPGLLILLVLSFGFFYVGQIFVVLAIWVLPAIICIVVPKLRSPAMYFTIASMLGGLGLLLFYFGVIR